MKLSPLQQKHGESAFVFLDERPWPFLVKQLSNGDWWLHYWAQGPRNFVTMRKIDADEVEKFRALALPDNKAAHYVPFNTFPNL